MKKCNGCKVTKSIEHFGKLSSKPDKLRSTCKSCRKDNYHSKEGKIKQIYNNQVKNSKLRGHNLPTYSKQEPIDWCMSQEIFHTLYDNWKRLDYQTWYAPSIDRKDQKLGYTISNIQLMSWIDNNMKSEDEQGIKYEL